MQTLKTLSKRQENLIGDFEIAASFFQKEGIKPKTLREFIDKAGHTTNDFYNVLYAMKSAEKLEGLLRLEQTFKAAGCNELLKASIVPSHLIACPNSENISDKIPEKTKQEPLLQKEEGPERAALFTVLNTLEKLNQRSRERVFASAQMFYGIGSL